MEVTTANIIQIAAYLVTFGIFLGVTNQQFSNLKAQLSAQEHALKLQLAAQEKQLALQIGNLEKKVEEHNKVVCRTYQNEKDIEVLKNRHKVSEHRLDDLERT